MKWDERIYPPEIRANCWSPRNDICLGKFGISGLNYGELRFEFPVFQYISRIKGSFFRESSSFKLGDFLFLGSIFSFFFSGHFYLDVLLEVRING